MLHCKQLMLHCKRSTWLAGHKWRGDTDRACGQLGGRLVHGAGVLEHGGCLTNPVHCALPAGARPWSMEPHTAWYAFSHLSPVMHFVDIHVAPL